MNFILKHSLLISGLKPALVCAVESIGMSGVEL